MYHTSFKYIMTILVIKLSIIACILSIYPADESNAKALSEVDVRPWRGPAYTESMLVLDSHHLSKGCSSSIRVLNLSFSCDRRRSPASMM